GIRLCSRYWYRRFHAVEVGEVDEDDPRARYAHGSDDEHDDAPRDLDKLYAAKTERARPLPSLPPDQKSGTFLDPATFSSLPATSPPRSSSLPHSPAPSLASSHPSPGNSILGPSINSLSRGGGSLVASDPRSSSSTISEVRDRSEEWINSVPSEVLVNFPGNEVNRQTQSNAWNSTYGSNGSNGIHLYAIGNGVNGGGYPNGNVRNESGSGSEDREALISFIDVLFNNILDLRETNRNLSPIIQRIGDIFLEAATELFRVAPISVAGHRQSGTQYIANSQPAASTAAYPSSSLPYGSSSDSSSSAYGDSSSSSSSPETSGVMPTVSVNPSGPSVTSPTGNSNSSSSNAAPSLDLKHYLTRPSEHLQKYPVHLTADGGRKPLCRVSARDY
ncbi:hypothetical protein F5879DRAFT_1062609, partial [Lentinula edodes]